MKIILSISVFFLLSSTFAQSFLTKGQVYDFNVGDVFQSVLTPSNGPPTYYTKKILAKTISSNNDTITYSIEGQNYTLAACPTCSVTYSIAISNLVVTDLSDSIIDAATTSIQATLDSTISVIDFEAVNSCNKKTRVRYQQLGPVITISPFTLYGESYIEGCGGPYSTYTSGNGGFVSSSNTQLIYYKKGNDSCGSFFNLPSSISTHNLGSLKLKLYPNPVQEKLIIISSSLFREYKILNLNGQVAQAGKVKNSNIDIKSLSSGLYSLQVEDEFQNKISRTFVKE